MRIEIKCQNGQTVDPSKFEWGPKQELKYDGKPATPDIQKCHQALAKMMKDRKKAELVFVGQIGGAAKAYLAKCGIDLLPAERLIVFVKKASFSKGWVYFVDIEAVMQDGSTIKAEGGLTTSGELGAVRKAVDELKKKLAPGK